MTVLNIDVMYVQQIEGIAIVFYYQITTPIHGLIQVYKHVLDPSHSVQSPTVTFEQHVTQQLTKQIQRDDVTLAITFTPGKIGC